MAQVAARALVQSLPQELPQSQVWQKKNFFSSNLYCQLNIAFLEDKFLALVLTMQTSLYESKWKMKWLLAVDKWSSSKHYSPVLGHACQSVDACDPVGCCELYISSANNCGSVYSLILPKCWIIWGTKCIKSFAFCHWLLCVEFNHHIHDMAELIWWWMRMALLL